MTKEEAKNLIRKTMPKGNSTIDICLREALHMALDALNQPEYHKVYRVDAKGGYSGASLIAADSVEEAREFVQEFRKYDKENKCNSWGYGLIKEEDLMDGLFSIEKGIIEYGIYYSA